ncbi:hypothetical protein J4050_01055 [Winogradskyella sp. DF17]|uniref:DUF6705 domain-containing protein n=1 Tax=Winogradskyella pelagia TaxID=2819984 RepID=A0ABS3SXU8_9FLAO|nr:DUF6705 family protein [Winogradskyella sp. DF17]MBO3115313.1 hypothetical protein [Winogradskyella sp. DF17]
MKKRLIILVAITCFACKAQSIIVPKGSGLEIQEHPNYYLKDVNNEFGKFVGEWKFDNGNSVIVLKLKKEELYQTNSSAYYQDLLVGEYKYVQNGLEIVNTLNNFDNADLSGYEHGISGGIFSRRLPNWCTDNSTTQEIKVELFIEHPNNDLIEGNLILRHIIDNGVEKLETCIYHESNLSYDTNARIPIPDGNYVFVKQD